MPPMGGGGEYSMCMLIGTNTLTKLIKCYLYLKRLKKRAQKDKNRAHNCLPKLSTFKN